MQQLEYELEEGDYIELSKLLKFARVAQTGGHAKILITEGSVKLNGEVDFRKRAKIRKGDMVEIDDVIIRIL